MRNRYTNHPVIGNRYNGFGGRVRPAIEGRLGEDIMKKNALNHVLDQFKKPEPLKEEKAKRKPKTKRAKRKAKG